MSHYLSFLFLFNDTATTEIYTLSLHDALPILLHNGTSASGHVPDERDWVGDTAPAEIAVRDRGEDRKSTRLNSSHMSISYAVFCLKKKKIYLVLVSMVATYDGN